jgi:type I site-specific restriction endonuclease
MAFTVNDLNDLLRILREQPEWLAEVRRVVLTDELLKLPDLVRELVEAQRRTDERLAEFQQRIERQIAEFQQRIERQMAEFQQRIEQQMAEFQQRIERQIAEFQQRTDQRFAELAEAQRRTDERLAEFQQRTEEQIGELKGTLLEMDYRAKVGAIFGSRLKKPKVVDAGDMWDVLRDRLDEEEIRQIVALDLIVRGRLLPPQGEGELWLAVEVSYIVDQNDVMRAAARAALLRKAGLPAIPVAAGKRLTQGASALATESRVVLVQDGSLVGWDDALQDASGERPSAA